MNWSASGERQLCEFRAKVVRVVPAGRAALRFASGAGDRTGTAGPPAFFPPSHTAAYGRVAAQGQDYSGMRPGAGAGGSGSSGAKVLFAGELPAKPVDG